MLKEIIINSSSAQTRVAITEDGRLVDFFVDYPENRKTVGDIYLGRVARVIPGIKAAFIDIGMKHDAFLHFSDIGDKTKEIQELLDEDDENGDTVSEYSNDELDIPLEPKLINGVPVLQKGERILIQITKEPVVNKGVRVTSAISIAGRFCVLLPFDNKVGVSKKITDFRERKRLRYIARQIIPKNCGLIIRTVARSQSEEAVKDDLRNLMKIWTKIKENSRSMEPPALVYQDVSTTSSVIRDLFTNDISKVYVDSKKVHKEIRDYISITQPELSDKIELYKQGERIFDIFNVEEQIKELFSRRVPLKSGGHIVIEHTEAMVVIDVNSGKYAASKDQEMNSLKTDLEAAREIVRQLRLRDIGGLIVVDFIDLEDDRNRRKVFDELKKEFRKDRAKVSMIPMSDFGLIEITRQRVRQNILQVVTENCPYCLGTGVLTKKSHTIHDIEEWLSKHKNTGLERSLILRCNPLISMKMREGFLSPLVKLQMKHLRRIKVEENPSFPTDKFLFISARTGKEIGEDISI
ncbi:MAG: Rne/Rng family ribonuclease [Ignavibacteriaceae bacterium]|nr:Rne/Rng family ribonuclease [Ignavibacteriaceae bacterium]